MSELLPHQQRVVDEHADLSEKIDVASEPIPDTRLPPIVPPPPVPMRP